jgi:hypothetical protein
MRGWGSYIPAGPHRRGISLLEVLAAIGVLSIGLLGLASLLPLGRYTISEAVKADRAGTLGRAAMRDIVVRRMLDSTTWTSNPLNSGTPPLSLLIDPDGLTNGMAGYFAGTPVPRIGLASITTTALAAAVFQATDDLVLPLPEDMSTIPAPYNLDPKGRPFTLTATGGTAAVPLGSSGNYSWFASVTPLLNNPTRFNVSVVVCYNRDRTTAGEFTIPVNKFFDTATVSPGGPPVALGGGNVQLAGLITNATSNVQVKENDWVALVSAAGQCRWYRIASMGDTVPGATTQNLALNGPDWVNPLPGSDKLVVVGQSVVGVYTTTIELDTDPLWKN